MFFFSEKFLYLSVERLTVLSLYKPNAGNSTSN